MAEHPVTASPVHGETVAGTEVHGAGHAPEPEFLGLGPAWFVSAAMVAVFLILIWKKVPGAIGAALDKKIAGIRDQLAEAEQLRTEAEALKAEYLAKAAAADAEAAVMIERARNEAQAIVEQARTDTAGLIERRTRIAEDKIAAAERAAVDEVRAKAADAAVAAAARIIAEDLGGAADRKMVDQTISGLGRAH
ncbi:F0F1 ATP synthase subunit B family protein [Sphingosinicella rhizophila]|uniref:ATP synthase subunit b n=1 Tax=Sphingosinicella rhizophila TaxID=3050082 RepID=A0ABU3QAQ7_9SPHN|nr:F0F1 ATP synthase subunit B [Sphingosinicella sp. GR2756]MDT9600451.1 F0F1 ATP synthase subunit B [Sphingosinicella sp. GR2756]